jgi:hypothetical protein
VLSSPPDFKSAEASLESAKNLLKKHSAYLLDIVGFDVANLDLGAAIVKAARFREGRGTIDVAVDSLNELALEAKDACDRVLESEARLRLAIIYAYAQRDADAERQLDIWRGYAPFIRNAALEGLYRTAHGMIQAHTLITRSETWDEQSIQLFGQMYDSAMLKADGVEVVARKELRMTKSEWDTWTRRHKAQEQKKKSQD